jgi:hypothetical protein
MPDGTTNRAQVANTCLPAGERRNKTLIFISGVRDARVFLVWLRASCPGGLTAQLKAEKLMVVPSKANCFRAVGAILSCLVSILELCGDRLYLSTGRELHMSFQLEKYLRVFFVFILSYMFRRGGSYATNRQVAGSIPDGVIGIFQ